MKIKVTKFLKFILITYSFRALILIIGAEIYLTAKVRISPTVIKGDSKMQFRVAENLDIIAKSPNEYVVNYKTNSLGFRNEEIKKEKDKDIIRIIGLGDSFTFGMGIEQKKTYLGQLQTNLISDLNKIEVLNQSF